MSRTDAILKRLSALHPKLIDLELGRTRRLLDALGRPQDRVPPVIHVAGTNGKGSTIAYLRAMLEAAGHSVHVYTSPHLVRFNERIRLAGTLVTSSRLNAALERCEEANAGAPITFFEITTCAAFLLFSETPADFLLLETGMGGEFDTTNVVERPRGTIITPISLDHTQFLGTRIEQIARTKAGILKPGAPAVFARQPELAMAELKARAEALYIEPFVGGEEFDGFVQRGRLVYEDDTGLTDLPLPALMGSHQVDNASVAIAAARHFQLALDDDAIAGGLRNAVWPARLTPLRGVLSEEIAEDQELWLDGGHNAAGAEALALALSDMNRARQAPLVLVTGMMASKDASRFFAPFKDMAERVYAVPIPGEDAALGARDLASHAAEQGLDTRVSRSVPAALRAAAAIEGARIVICGSLYLAGHVLARNKTPPT